MKSSALQIPGNKPSLRIVHFGQIDLRQAYLILARAYVKQKLDVPIGSDDYVGKPQQLREDIDSG